MTPWLQDADVTLYHGDVLTVLRELPAESVDCCVTSPPYWGLRDYGTGAWEGGDEGCDHRKVARDVHRGRQGNTKGSPMDARFKADCFYGDVCGKCGATRIDQQLGLEPTLEEYVTRMVEVFREVRRVLASHGTVWLNLGDSYAHGTPGGGSVFDNGRNDGRVSYDGDKVRGREKVATLAPGLKAKDLVGIPWRVAFALQADGWYLRSDIIWAKPNPMPESVTDRPTKAHEYVFLLSKAPRYFFDQDAVREPWGEGTAERYAAGYNASWKRAQEASVTDKREAGFYGSPEQLLTRAKGPEGRRKTTVQGADGSIQHRDGERWPNGGRNIRSVWEIATQPYPEAHFATFPEELARRCIAAGTSERGKCPECGAPWVRKVEWNRTRTGGEVVLEGNRYEGLGKHRGIDQRSATAGWRKRPPDHATTIGWHPTCECGEESGVIGQVGTVARSSVPAVVLDPFMGSGTVAHVARKLGRHAVGIDLNESYLELAARRLQQQSLFAEAAS